MTTEVKKIGTYKLKCKTTSDNSDFINLNVQVDANLLKLIKEVSVSETQDCQIRTGNNSSGNNDYTTFKRHKVKRWIYGSIYSDEARDVLFAKELVSKAKMDIQFSSVDKLEHFVDGLKRATKSLIETFNSYEDVEFAITYNCDKQVEEPSVETN